MNDSPRVLGNRYEVGDLLGRGGMAEVHLGRDTRLGRSVAIKLLRTDLARDPTFQARFRREAQSAAALNHPAIVSVYDTGEESVVEAGGAVVNLPYIVMEHIAGQTLRDLLAEHHHLDVDFALEITTGVLAALEYSHRIGIVHRDIKPANVMLTPTGDVKVMDFGIARAMADSSSTMTQTQAVIGTAQYLSPEQARGEQVDTRSDLYSAGCLLFELLTGRPPFVADSPVAVAYQHVREPAPPPSQFVPGIPESVDRIVLHSLAKGREERYQTAAEFRADVEAARGGRQVMATVPVMDGPNATTQYVPAAAAGTRAMGPVTAGAGGLLGQTGVGTYPGYPETGQYGQPDQTPPRSRRGPIIAGIAVVVVAAILGFLLFKILGGGGSGSAATADLTVPTVNGLTASVAVGNIKDAGFTAAPTQTTAKSATVDKGDVISSDPAQGATAPTDTVIALVVSAGPDVTKVPDLKGMSVADAQKALAAANLTPGATQEKVDISEKAGLVVSSDPAAGEQVAPDTEVTIFTSSASAEVPNLVGLTRGQAHSKLRSLGLQWQDTVRETDSGAPGTVFDQSIPQGQSLLRGKTIGLSIAKAPADVTPTPTDSTPVTDPPPSASASASTPATA